MTSFLSAAVIKDKVHDICENSVLHDLRVTSVTRTELLQFTVESFYFQMTNISKTKCIDQFTSKYRITLNWFT